MSQDEVLLAAAQGSGLGAKFSNSGNFMPDHFRYLP
jgi:hypothetical protein